MANSYEKIVGKLLGQERLRRSSFEQNLAMMRGNLEPGQSASLFAKRNGLNSNQFFMWRGLCQKGSLSEISGDLAVVPVSELKDALKRIREVQRAIGKKIMKAAAWRARHSYHNAVVAEVREHPGSLPTFSWKSGMNPLASHGLRPAEVA